MTHSVTDGSCPILYSLYLKSKELCLKEQQIQNMILYSVNLLLDVVIFATPRGHWHQQYEGMSNDLHVSSALTVINSLGALYFTV